jgi:predicted flap endonuclease-1-like 5' DNA nuclease
MKLTEIAIEGSTFSGRVQLSPLDRGLNFVYGENGAGKTALSSFLRGMLVQGGEGSVRPKTLAMTGYAACTSNVGSCTLRQMADPSQPIRIESPQHGQTPIGSLSQMTGAVTPLMHDTLFNFSLREANQKRQDLARLLHENFAVALGPEAADLTVTVDHQPQIRQLKNELNQLLTSIDTLNQTHARLAGEISLKQTDQRRLVDLNQQIDQLTGQLSRLDRTQIQSHLAAIDAEIQTLQSTIDRAAASYVSHSTPQPANDGFKHLYQRLDEVDQQIKRWRHVQSDVQNQRVRLKDEMIVWNEMTLESDAHPYHNAQEILIGLESRVDQAEQTAARWSGTTASQVDVSQMANAVEDICGQMRDDLYSLCAELSTQYKNIRQRAAAVELKQLRRCYHEMGENTARLVQRRQQVIDEIRAIDPAGADAILRSEQAFCQCAAHEGYLAARRRFIGPVQPTAPTVTRVEPDLSAERTRISQLTNERNDIFASLNRIDLDRGELDRQLSSLIIERDAMSASDVGLLEAQLRQVENDLRSTEAKQFTLQTQLDELASLPVARPSQVLIEAGQLLSQMTQGNLTQVFLSDETGHDVDGLKRFDLQIRDGMGRVHNFTGLDNAGKNHVYLSLALAMVDSLRNSSIAMPMIIDDSFVHIGPDHVTATLNTIDQFCRQHDQQIILLSQHYYLADRLSTMPRFELPPPNVPTRAPYQSPLRSTPPVRTAQDSPQAPSVSSNINVVSNYDTQPQYVLSNHNRPYPLAKYSTSPAAIGEISEVESDFRLPWSPLNRDAQSTSRASVRPTSPETFVSFQTGSTPVAIDSMSLASTGLFDLNILGDLHEAGIMTVEQLLELDVEQLERGLIGGNMNLHQLENALSSALIYWAVPGLTPEEAKLIVAIGITDPETLANFDADRLVARIDQFFGSAEGQRFQRTISSGSRAYSISGNRASEWHRSLLSNRSRWSRRPRLSRHSRSNNRVDSTRRPRTSRSNDRAAETYRVSNYTQRSERSPRTERTPRPPRERMDHGNLERRDSTRQPAALRPVAGPVEQSRSMARSTVGSQSNRSNSRSKSHDNKKLKFYLNLSDDLEAAPSIGPKTAERFEKIGIITVADFLRQTAESMAERLNYKRLSAEVLRTWQHQTRMVCRIPNLRGHDAQLLVACDVIEPDELAIMDPRVLFDVIGPFSDTKEGLKIIRSGKKPDLEEVTDWIDWARHTRSLQAA